MHSKKTVLWQSWSSSVQNFDIPPVKMIAEIMQWKGSHGSFTALLRLHAFRARAIGSTRSSSCSGTLRASTLSNRISAEQKTPKHNNRRNKKQAVLHTRSAEVESEGWTAIGWWCNMSQAITARLTGETDRSSKTWADAQRFGLRQCDIRGHKGCCLLPVHTHRDETQVRRCHFFMKSLKDSFCSLTVLLESDVPFWKKIHDRRTRVRTVYRQGRAAHKFWQVSVFAQDTHTHTQAQGTFQNFLCFDFSVMLKQCLVHPHTGVTRSSFWYAICGKTSVHETEVNNFKLAISVWQVANSHDNVANSPNNEGLWTTVTTVLSISEAGHCVWAS